MTGCHKSCKNILLALLTALEEDPNNEKILEKKIKVFCHLGNLQSAFALVSDWVKQNPEVGLNVTLSCMCVSE